MFHDEDELTGLEEHLRDSENLGDARRCPRHPGVKTSSDDGMFDGVCDVCEGEMSDEAAMWDYDATNPRRPYCALGPVRPSLPRYPVRCENEPDEEIPF